MAGVLDLGIAPPTAPEVDLAAAGDEAAPGADAIADELAGLGDGPTPAVDEPMVRGLLSSASSVVHTAVGDEDVPEHWRFTPRELDELTPPLTRYLNRNARLRAVAVRGDEAAIALALAGYMGRNLTDLQRARRAREDDDGLDREGADPGPRRDGVATGGRWPAGARDATSAPGPGADGPGMAR